jgi:phospholipid-binding lipoprotein MlaA
MKCRYPRRLAALLLILFLAGAPAAAPAEDNAAGLGNAVASPSPPAVESEPASPPGHEEAREPSFGGETPPPSRIADPLEPVNRAMFVFNDKAYHWVFKPAAKGYSYVVPQGVREAVRNFFANLAAPVRVANHLLQGNLRATGTELLRFTMNSTIGMAGLFDPAHDGFHIERREADLGQTLGRYGLGQGLYIVLPFLGPTTLRDGAGLAGDAFLDPLSYIRPPEASIGARAYKMENGLSLRIGEYEDLTGSALDPYVAVRDAYIQHRAALVRKKPY